MRNTEAQQVTMLSLTDPKPDCTGWLKPFGWRAFGHKATFKVPMKQEIIAAYLKHFSNYRRMTFSFSGIFFVLEILIFFFVLCKWQEKCNRHCTRFHKTLITLKNTWLEMDEMGVAKLFNAGLISGCEEKLFRLFFFLLNQRKAVRDAIITILLLKTYQKWLLC